MPSTELKDIYYNVATHTTSLVRMSGRVKNMENLHLYFRSTGIGTQDNFRLVVEIGHDWRLKSISALELRELGRAINRLFANHDLQRVPSCPRCGGVMGIHLYVDYMEPAKGAQLGRIGCANYDLPWHEVGYKPDFPILELKCIHHYPVILHLDDPVLDTLAVPFSPVDLAVARLEQLCALLTNIHHAQDSCGRAL